MTDKPLAADRAHVLREILQEQGCRTLPWRPICGGLGIFAALGHL
jgi:hypothetical protein